MAADKRWTVSQISVVLALLVNTGTIAGGAIYVGRRDEVLTQTVQQAARNTHEITELRSIARDLAVASAQLGERTQGHAESFGEIRRRLESLERGQQ